MPGLIIDSSSDTLILALGPVRDDAPALSHYRIFDEAARLGSSLFLLIENFLNDRNIEAKNLSYIAAGRGPGSYTGTRAAVAAATGFSLAANVPLVLFPSLLAFLPPLFSGKLAAILEIKGSKELYTLLYEVETGSLQEKRLPLEELAQELLAYDAVASAKPIENLLGHYPLFFTPELAISRIATWVEQRRFSAVKEESVIYLQPLA